MKYLRNVLVFLLLLAGAFQCTVLTDNPWVVDAAVERATVEYIKGDTVKADRVVETVTALRQVIDDDVDVSTDAILDTLESRIDWQALDTAQQAVLTGVLNAVEADLRKRQSNDRLVNARRLLDVVILTAKRTP